MNFPFALERLFKRSIVKQLWYIAALLVTITKAAPHRHNNYTIFRSSFYHFLEGQPLYSAYPAEHLDFFLYGPVFPILFSPFALLPGLLGMMFWLLASVAGCMYAVKHLPTTEKKQMAIMWIAFLDLYTALCMQQLNILIAACIIFSFSFLEKKREWAATLFIALGTLTKLYGIVGLAFFPFAKRKGQYIGWFFFWMLLLGFLPIIGHGWSYAIGQYSDWLLNLTNKNSENLFSLYQNISLLGMVRKITAATNYSDLWLILPGLVLFILPFVRFNQYKAPLFRMNILASTLLFTVLFSTGSESSTYIIALLGVGIWFTHRPQEKADRIDMILLIGTIVLSSLSPTDLFPATLRKGIIIPFALKALFPSLIWIKISFELLRLDYTATTKSDNKLDDQL